MPSPIPIRPAATAPQPSRRSPRSVAAEPERRRRRSRRAPARAASAPDRRHARRGTRRRRARSRRCPTSAAPRSAVPDRLSSRSTHVAHACAPAQAELPARVPDVEDEDVGADEEHDQALDHVREVAGELGLDHVRAAGRASSRRGARRRAARRDPMPTAVLRPSSATAMPRKPIARHRDVGDAEAVEVAEHVEPAGEAREGAGDRHRADEVLLAR